MAEVLPVSLHESQPYFSSAPLRRSSSHSSILFATPSYSSRKLASSTTYEEYLNDPPTASSSSRSSSSNSRTDLSKTSSASTVSDSLTLETSFDVEDALSLPTYGGPCYVSPRAPDESPTSPRADDSAPPASPVNLKTPSNTPESRIVSEDDTSLKVEPSRHVDYLSHEWVEEDIWSSWRLIVSKRKVYGERSRLENASWRTWAKRKYGLRTVPPDTLNWLKDCDVTWLYGPLQTARNYSISEPQTGSQTEPASHLSKSNSFLHNKKPILKKRSMSEVMLQQSLSSASLLKQAAAAVQAQQLRPSIRNRPAVGRVQSDFSAITTRTGSTATSHSYTSSHSSSGLVTPENSEKRHIRFDDRVEQCIAVDLKETDDDDEGDTWAIDDSDDSSDDGIIMMKTPTASRIRRPPSRSNSSSKLVEAKIIEKLEPTTLKYRTDSPEVAESHSLNAAFWNRKGNISPSPSQETLRSSSPSRNFLLAEEDDDEDMSWNPSAAYGRGEQKPAFDADGYAAETQREAGSGSGLKRTASGMLMPYDEEEDPRNTGILGRVVDTVNTARDIAHVIWNVGWRS